MKTIDPAHKKNADTNYRPVDVSRFTRWINQLDEKDKQLGSPRRKQKWLILMGVLFLIFILSFIWVPPIQLVHKNLEIPPASDSMQVKKTVPLPFEIPTDSIEKQLKMRLNENFSKGK